MNLILYIIFTLYFFGSFQLFNFGTFGVQPTYPFVFLLYIFCITLFVLRKRQLITNPVTSVKLVFLLQIFAGISFFYVFNQPNGDPDQFFKTYLHFIFLTSCVIFLGMFEFNNKVIVNIIKIWLIISILINIFGVYQLFARAFDLPLAWIDLTNASLTHTETETYNQLSLRFENFYRATSIFSEPSSLAGFNLSIIGFLILPMFKAGTYKIFKSKKFLSFIFILSIVTLFLTFSLTGLLGAFVLFMVYLVYGRNISIKKIFQILVIVALSIIVVDQIVEYYFDTSVLELFYMRVAGILGFTKTISGESFGSRSFNFAKSLEVWLKSPLIGVGLGQTGQNSQYISYSDYAMMHALMETGILGGLTFFFIFISGLAEFFLIRKCIDKLQKQSSYLLYCGLFNLCLLFIISSITSNSFIGLFLWINLGFVVIILTNVKRELGYDTKPIWFYKKKALPDERALDKSS